MNIKVRRTNNAPKVIENNLFLFKMCYKICPSYVILFCVNVLKNSLIVYLEFTIGLNYILECAEYGKDYFGVLVYLLFLVCLITIGMILGAWLDEEYKMKKMPYIRAYFKNILYDKAKEVDLKNYDDPEYFNDLNFSIAESDAQIDRMFSLLEKIITSISTFILTGVFFAVKDFYSLLFVFVIFGGSFWVNNSKGKLNYRISIERNPLEKKRDYLNRTFYMADYAKEIRLNVNLFNRLAEDFEKINVTISEIDKKNASKKFLQEFLGDFICASFVHNTLYMFFLVYRASVVKAISYSNIVVLFRAASRIKNSMQMFSSIYPYAAETSRYVERIRSFLERASEIDESGTRKFPKQVENIEFRNVFFSYKKGDSYTIKNLSFKMNKGKYALVGANGAGKTTLIKLLMRMYDVTKGEILLNGINIKEYDLKEYRRGMGAVFQDYCIYAISLAENVVMRNINEETKEDIEDALNKAGFSNRLKKLRNGIETQVTTEFYEDGVNFSGGEAQKIAVSRIYFDDKSVFILDEPSSALDPIAEYSFNKSIVSNVDNKVTIFISHRMSTTRFSDHVFVLENGEICEEGTHDELLRRKGLYSQMWECQSSLYSDTSKEIDFEDILKA